MKYIKYYRVQGGEGKNQSRNMLTVTDNNTLDLSQLKRIHIAGEEHNRNFIKLRSQEKSNKYRGHSDNYNNVDVIVMYFPEFFGELLRDNSIDQYISTDGNIYAPPHRVDENQGEAYDMYGVWNGIMKASCLYAKKYNIGVNDNIEQLYNNEQEPEFNQINLAMLESCLNLASTCDLARIDKQKITQILTEARLINQEIKSKKIQLDENER